MTRLRQIGLRLRRSCFAALVVGVALAVGCGGGGGDDAGDKTVDVTVPEGDEFKFELSGAREVDVAASGSDRFQRSGETRLNFTGVADDGENFSLMFLVPAVEGETGTYETVKTSQLTHGSARYKTDRLTAELERHDDGRIEGTVQGAFGQKESGGSYESISPGLEIVGRFDFTY